MPYEGSKERTQNGSKERKPNGTKKEAPNTNGKKVIPKKEIQSRPAENNPRASERPPEAQPRPSEKFKEEPRPPVVAREIPVGSFSRKITDGPKPNDASADPRTSKHKPRETSKSKVIKDMGKLSEIKPKARNTTDIDRDSIADTFKNINGKNGKVGPQITDPVKGQELLYKNKLDELKKKNPNKLTDQERMMLAMLKKAK